MDSAFWRDLAAQFIMLASEFDQIRVGIEFEILARRGVARFNPAPMGDFLSAWTEAVCQRKKDDRTQEVSRPSLRELCRFSADFCNVMERLAVESERGTLIVRTIPVDQAPAEASTDSPKRLVEHYLEGFPEKIMK